MTVLEWFGIVGWVAAIGMYFWLYFFLEKERKATWAAYEVDKAMLDKMKADSDMRTQEWHDFVDELSGKLRQMSTAELGNELGNAKEVDG